MVLVKWHGCARLGRRRAGAEAAAHSGSRACPDSPAAEGAEGGGSAPTVRVAGVILCRPSVRGDLIPSDMQHHSWD